MTTPIKILFTYTVGGGDRFYKALRFCWGLKLGDRRGGEVGLAHRTEHRSER